VTAAGPGSPGAADPVGSLLALMAALDPALGEAAVLAALGQAAARPTDGGASLPP